MVPDEYELENRPKNDVPPRTSGGRTPGTTSGSATAGASDPRRAGRPDSGRSLDPSLVAGGLVRRVGGGGPSYGTSMPLDTMGSNMAEESIAPARTRCLNCGFEADSASDDWTAVDYAPLGTLTQCPECRSTDTTRLR